VAALGGAEVYRALGAGANITYWSDIQDGNHCANRAEWRVPLQQHIQKYLLRTGDAAGAIRISSRAPGNLAEWRDWQTPDLGSTPPASPPPSGGCVATASVNAWTGGFVATIKITAGPSGITGWNAGLTLPAGATITNTWNANRTGTTGAVQFSNVAYNGKLAAGQSTEFGFQATGPSAPTPPTCSPV